MVGAPAFSDAILGKIGDTSSTWTRTAPMVKSAVGPRTWPTRARPEFVPDLRPAPGHYLLDGVEAVLARLASTPHGELADELRAALARTAACGDTCRVREAADAVREAAGLLRSGAGELAGAVLVRVHDELT